MEEEYQDTSEQFSQSDLLHSVMQEISASLRFASLFYAKENINYALNSLVSIRFRLSPYLSEKEKKELEETSAKIQEHLQNYKTQGFDRKDGGGLIKAKRFYQKYNDLIMNHLTENNFLPKK